MSNLTELTAQIIVARAAKKDMSTEELLQEMQMVYSFLKGAESGEAQVTAAVPPAEEPVLQKINFKQIFKKDEVICLICNKGFKTLKKHLTQAHQLTDKEYKMQFGIAAKQPLVAKAYSEKKRADAQKNNLGAKMQAGRKAKSDQKAVAVPAVKVKAPLPVAKVKAPLPVKREKPGLPVTAKKSTPKSGK